MSLLFSPQTAQTDLQFRLGPGSPPSPALPQSVKPGLHRYESQTRVLNCTWTGAKTVTKDAEVILSRKLHSCCMQHEVAHFRGAGPRAFCSAEGPVCKIYEDLLTDYGRNYHLKIRIILLLLL